MGSGKKGLAISENPNRTAASQLQLLLSKARSVALQTSDTVAEDIIQELCSTIDSLQTTQAEVRREAFRDAVRGIAGAIRKDQVPAAVPGPRTYRAHTPATRSSPGSSSVPMPQSPSRSPSSASSASS